MTIPESSRYPDILDADDNLYLVHDALRLRLAEDYTPGDNFISVEGDIALFNRFPSSGLLTLTDQCNELDDRALSFFYSNKNNEELRFEGLELLPQFDGKDTVSRPKRLTHITQNVMAEHHNAIKDALIAIEEFIGVRGTIDAKPFGPTMEGRINFLRKLVLRPRAWFSLNKRIGLVPLTIEFKDLSFRLGTGCGDEGPVVFIWDFGDQTGSVISILSTSSTLVCSTVPSTISVISTVFNTQTTDSLSCTTVGSTISCASVTEINLVPSTIVTFPTIGITECNYENTAAWNCFEVPLPISTISVTSVVPTQSTNVVVQDMDGGTVQKTYNKPGVYDVTLTVRSNFGEDTIKIPGIVQARIQAPDPAVITFNVKDGQIFIDGTPVGGPYEVPPRIRSNTGTLIDLEVKKGINSATHRAYSGEILDDCNFSLDPVNEYIWGLGDDLNHANSRLTKASYSVGGIYDLKLRVNTESESYRITTYENSIDIVENVNLWLWTIDSTLNARSYEFGLISETFKVGGVPHSVDRNSDFLKNQPNASKQKFEFERNTGFLPRGTIPSGLQGTSILYYASGRNEEASVSSEQIRFVEYNGFKDVYINKDSIDRPWNWTSFGSSNQAFFLFGYPTTSILPFTSPTNNVKTTLSLIDFSATSQALLTTNFKGGAEELLSNLSSYNGAGETTTGHFSVYRSAFKDRTGYILRNDGIGDFFRIKSFYRTEGNVADTIQSIAKLDEMGGSTKFEGQLVSLSDGLFFLNNTGAVSAYSPITDEWITGGPGINSTSFRSLQDPSVEGFDNEGNTLLAASDNDRRAYLSFDYSSNVFIKFIQADTTFKSLGSRPIGNQWIMGVM